MCLRRYIHTSAGPLRNVSTLLRQRERDDVVALLGAELAVTSRGDDEVLLAVEIVCHRSGLAACGKLIAPEFLAGFRVGGAYDGRDCGGSENQPTSCDHRATEVDRTCLLPQDQRPEWNIPDFPPREKIHG